jgi:hypothetical protein
MRVPGALWQQTIWDKAADQWQEYLDNIEHNVATERVRAVLAEHAGAIAVDDLTRRVMAAVRG